MRVCVFRRGDGETVGQDALSLVTVTVLLLSLSSPTSPFGGGQKKRADG